MGLIWKGQFWVQDGFWKLKDNTHGEIHTIWHTVLGVFTNAYSCILYHNQGTGQSFPHPKFLPVPSQPTPHATPDLLRPYSSAASKMPQKGNRTRLPESATSHAGYRFCDSPVLSGSRACWFSTLAGLPQYEGTRVCLSMHRLDTEMVSSLGQL